jgi:hypothetical protein
VAVARRDRQARILEGMLLGEDADDFEYACSRIRHAGDVDLDRVVEQYASLKEDDPRRTRLGNAYQRLARAPIEGALRRLFPRTTQAEQAASPPATKEAPEDPNAKLVKQLFSTDKDEHEKAADELRVPDPDPKVLEAIVQRYRQLPRKDPRREWIEQAYTSLNSEGETIQAAVKRLEKLSPPKSPGPQPTPNAPKPAPPAPPPEPEPDGAREGP